ncbi:hypothetical protein D3C75_948650 [compost metagenome]
MDKYAHRYSLRSAFLDRIIEKYSLSAKKVSTIKESNETTGLKRVAKLKITNMPHQVLKRTPIPE